MRFNVDRNHYGVCDCTRFSVYEEQSGATLHTAPVGTSPLLGLGLPTGQHLAVRTQPEKEQRAPQKPET